MGQMRDKLGQGGHKYWDVTSARVINLRGSCVHVGAATGDPGGGACIQRGVGT